MISFFFFSFELYHSELQAIFKDSRDPTLFLGMLLLPDAQERPELRWRSPAVVPEVSGACVALGRRAPGADGRISRQF